MCARASVFMWVRKKKSFTPGDGLFTTTFVRVVRLFENITLLPGVVLSRSYSPAMLAFVFPLFSVGAGAHPSTSALPVIQGRVASLKYGDNNWVLDPKFKVTAKSIKERTEIELIYLFISMFIY